MIMRFTPTYGEDDSVVVVVMIAVPVQCHSLSLRFHSTLLTSLTFPLLTL